MYDDMLEITSPGDVLPSINLENLADNPSEIRNRILAPIFKECGLIEQWGTSFKKSIKEMKQYPELELKINEPGLSFQIQFVKKNTPGTIKVHYQINIVAFYSCESETSDTSFSLYDYHS